MWGRCGHGRKMYIKLGSRKENKKKMRENMKIVEEGIKKLRREM